MMFSMYLNYGVHYCLYDVFGIYVVVASSQIILVVFLLFLGLSLRLMTRLTVLLLANLELKEILIFTAVLLGCLLL
jgi:hypothetical protein